MTPGQEKCTLAAAGLSRLVEEPRLKFEVYLAGIFFGGQISISGSESGRTDIQARKDGFRVFRPSCSRISHITLADSLSTSANQCSVCFCDGIFMFPLDVFGKDFAGLG